MLSGVPSTRAFRVGGALPPQYPNYVTREADNKLLELCRQGELCFVLNSRQMGKSSLRNRVMYQLSNDGATCLALDLSPTTTQAGADDKASAETWYYSICFRIYTGFKLGNLQEFRAWWEERSDLPPHLRLEALLEYTVLPSFDHRVVLLIDEVDALLSLGDFSDSFLRALRSFYDRRSVSKDLQRLSLVLLGVASPHELIKDHAATPFNSGHYIDLGGFTLEEARGSLVGGLRASAECPEEALGQVIYWTHGQPFLTQKLCSLLAVRPEPIRRGEEQQAVRAVVFDKIIDNWEANDRPEHLQTIRSRLLKSPGEHTIRILDLYRRILAGEAELPGTGDRDVMELRLAGVIAERAGSLEVFNRIYKEVFDAAWVEAELDRQRPYASQIRAWLGSGKQDDRPLLNEDQLHSTQAWAHGKTLSPTDYEFIAASAERHTQRLATRAARALRQFRSAVAGLVLVGLLAALVVIVAMNVVNTARENARNSNQQLAGARLALTGVQGELVNAEKNLNLARKQEQDAIRSRLLIRADGETERGARLLEAGNSLGLLHLLTAKESYDQAELRPAPVDRVWARWQAAFEQQELQFIGNQDLDAPIGMTADERRMLVMKGNGARLTLLDRASQVELKEIRLPGMRVSGVRFLNNRKLLMACYGSELFYKNLESFERVNEKQKSPAELPAKDLALFEKREDYSMYEYVRFWKLPDLIPLRAPFHNPTDREPVASVNGKRLVTAVNATTLQVWNIDSGRAVGSPLRHQKEVRDVVFSPDGDLLAVVTDLETFSVKGQALWLWNAETGTRIAGPVTHYDGVSGWSVAFSPDSKLLTIGIDPEEDGKENTLQLLSARSGKPVGKPMRHADEWNQEVRSVTFTATGKHLLTTTEDQSVWLWKVPEGAPVGEPLQDHKLLDVSSDGTFFVTQANDGSVRLWSTNNRQAIGEPIRARTRIEHTALSPNGQYLACGSRDGTVQLWNTQNARPVGSPKWHPQMISELEFSPRGEFLVTHAVDHQLRIWRCGAGAANGTPLVYQQWVGDADDSAVDPQGRFLLISDFWLKRWDTAGNSLARRPRWSARLAFDQRWGTDSESKIAFNAESTLAAVGDNGTIQLLDTRNGNQRGPEIQLDAPVRGLGFEPGGRTLVVLSYFLGLSTAFDNGSIQGSATVERWDVATGRRLGKPWRSPDRVRYPLLCNNGRNLTGVMGESLWCWNTATGKPSITPVNMGRTILKVRVSPDSRCVAATLGGGRSIARIRDLLTDEVREVRLVKAATGQAIGKPLRHQALDWDATYSPDGALVATQEIDGAVRLWDTKTSKPYGTALYVRGQVQAVGIGQSGALVAIAVRDGGIGVWDSQTGLPLGPEVFHQGDIHTLEFAAQGTLLVARSHTVGYSAISAWRLPVTPAQSLAEMRLRTAIALGVRTAAAGQPEALTGKQWRTLVAELRRAKGARGSVGPNGNAPTSRLPEVEPATPKPAGPPSRDRP